MQHLRPFGRLERDYRRGRQVDDEPGFDDFVAEQTDALLRYGYVLTGNPHDAADLVQEALVRLYGAWPRVRRKDSPHSFFKVTLRGPGDQAVLTLYDADTGRSADLGIRSDARGTMAIPDGGLDRLMTYPIKNEMYVLDLAAIE
jgi:sigma-70-like protein